MMVQMVGMTILHYHTTSSSLKECRLHTLANSGTLIVIVSFESNSVHNQHSIVGVDGLFARKGIEHILDAFNLTRKAHTHKTFLLQNLQLIL